MLAIETIDLSKRFSGVRALDGLAIRVEAGEVYGLLGPNGAGKSTLIHLLLGFLRPSAGRLRVLGKSPAAARSRVGYLPEHARYHGHFNPREYLFTSGRLADVDDEALRRRIPALLELVGLRAVANRRIGDFSKGMLQRLGIAQAIVHEPALLLVDEPTAGLDPAGQREMLDLLAELRRRGHTILLCTHILAEAEALCDRVGILDAGKLAAEAAVLDLATAGAVDIIARDVALPDAVSAALANLGPAVQVDANTVRVLEKDSQERALRILLDAGVPVAGVKPAVSGLEELYLNVTRSKGPSKDGARGA